MTISPQLVFKVNLFGNCFAGLFGCFTTVSARGTAVVFLHSAIVRGRSFAWIAGAVEMSSANEPAIANIFFMVFLFPFVIPTQWCQAAYLSHLEQLYLPHELRW